MKKNQIAIRKVLEGALTVTEVEIHPQWKELMEYVEKSGGFLRLEIRFQDGLPVVAEHIRKQVRFGIRTIKARRKRLLKNPANSAFTDKKQDFTN